MRHALLVVLSLGLTALLFAAAPAAAAAEPPCPPGQAWDAPMAMCMPAPDVGGPGAMSHGAAHGAMPGGVMLDRMISPDSCGEGSYFLFAMSMCLPRPRARGAGWVMPMLNVFLTDGGAVGPRGYHALSAPNWLMAQGAVDLAAWYRLELDVMLTAELWTLPGRGHPELLQIGETDAAGRPFLDAQHPHSSPLMGLTLTNVFSLSRTSTRLLRVSFAPRGWSSDGPIPFMHRPTAMVNPDAPLGHHVGQDAGHISSTVIAVSAYLGGTLVEASTFHGREPSPTAVDLPLGAPDSFALRLAQRIGRPWLVSASVAYVSDPEGGHEAPHDAGAGHADTPYVVRLSASGYAHHDLPRGWRSHATLIWGGILNYDGAPFLTSLGGEALFTDHTNSLWTRLEALQRTAGQLAVPAADPTAPAWVGAMTAGYTRRIVTVWGLDLAVGGSGTLSLVPEDLAPAYGGRAIVSGRLFLQAIGMKMWGFGPRGGGAG